MRDRNDRLYSNYNQISCCEVINGNRTLDDQGNPKKFEVKAVTIILGYFKHQPPHNYPHIFTFYPMRRHLLNNYEYRLLYSRARDVANEFLGGQKYGEIFETNLTNQFIMSKMPRKRFLDLDVKKILEKLNK